MDAPAPQPPSAAPRALSVDEAVREAMRCYYGRDHASLERLIRRLMAQDRTPPQETAT